ncbi:MFS transporter [Salinisphaera sp. Q1T1-3]|uniref:MFS transporter n=1 Tax=Salinisphaera sp. Q1T1-3 TaxID=2321229 RepID=UPI000E74C9F3|nr:MFS transporter [Salinisphaera sp. Q1T1-3]RJS91099.1 MFS transporter [Salinisphaera sp. Q1T1-3]
MSRAPTQIIEQSPMGALQIVAITLTVLLNGLDGFDVLAISFASPGIASEFGIDRSALGFVLAAELIGMSVGSVVLGSLSDKLGRRPLILFCLLTMSLGMFGSSSANSVLTLAIWRIATGVGIGGMLAAITATAAEHSNEKNRSFCVALSAIGYPIGAVLGGSVAAWLLSLYDWRSVFIFGGTITAVFLPIVWLGMPETIAHLAQKQPRNALSRINRILARMGHAAVDQLPVPRQAEFKTPTAELFAPTLIRRTILVTLAYFLHIATFYFILKWVPKIVVDMGFVASSAAGVLVWANVGGAIGGITLGFITRRLPTRLMTIIALLGAFVMVSVFGMGQSTIFQLSLIAAIAGFFTNSGVVGLYALFAEAFPTQVRGAGTGFAIGVGRGGAALSPILAGFLFDGGLGLQGVAIIMASGALIAAVCLMLLRTADLQNDQRQAS